MAAIEPVKYPSCNLQAVWPYWEIFLPGSTANAELAVQANNIERRSFPSEFDFFARELGISLRIGSGPTVLLNTSHLWDIHSSVALCLA
jgi:hypothetical protein